MTPILETLTLERKLAMKTFILATMLALTAASATIVISAVAGEQPGSHPIDVYTGR